MTLSSGDQHTHLRANAAVQKQTTVNRLSQAITLLEAEGRPVNTFTIKEVSGLDYMTYYRNREAFQLFQEHSTHLRKEREQEQAKRQAASRASRRKTGQGKTVLHAVKVSPRDPLLDYKRPRLVELLHEACAERDEAKRQVQVERAEVEQRASAERTELEQRNHKLLQEHMQCGTTMRNSKRKWPSTWRSWSAFALPFDERSTNRTSKVAAFACPAYSSSSVIDPLFFNGRSSCESPISSRRS